MLYVLTAAAVCGLDQLLKLWVKANVDLGASRTLIPGILGITNVRNTGMAFSLLSDYTWLLAVLSIVVTVGLFVVIFRFGLPGVERFALSLVAGGAVGNALDRILQGFVVDMFEVQFVHFAVFNLADVFIDVGVVLFCVLYIVRQFREERRSRGGERLNTEGPESLDGEMPDPEREAPGESEVGEGQRHDDTSDGV